jgi:hypothetical protein
MTALRRSEEAAGAVAVCNMIVKLIDKGGEITLKPPKLKEKIHFWRPYLRKEQT